MSQPICRALKNQKCLTAYESKEHRGLVKHEGWDKVTSVPTSRNLDGRFHTLDEAQKRMAENPDCKWIGLSRRKYRRRHRVHQRQATRSVVCRPKPTLG